MNGQVVQTGIAQPNERILIENLVNGNYIICMKNGSVGKFIKD
jgi:hypothetical protein